MTSRATLFPIVRKRIQSHSPTSLSLSKDLSESAHRIAEKYTAEKFVLTLTTARPAASLSTHPMLMSPRRPATLPSRRHTNLPRYPRRARAPDGMEYAWRLQHVGSRTGAPRIRARTSASIHAAKQIRRLGYAINVGAATPYGLVRATVRCPLSPRGRPTVPVSAGKEMWRLNKRSAVQVGWGRAAAEIIARETSREVCAYK